MAWVAFTAAFTWSPPERRGRVTLQYAAGWRGPVRRACAEAAAAAGRAQVLPAPPRHLANPVREGSLPWPAPPRPPR